MVTGITQLELLQIAFILVISYMLATLGNHFSLQSLSKTYDGRSTKEVRFIGLRFLDNTLLYFGKRKSSSRGKGITFSHRTLVYKNNEKKEAR